MHGPAIAAALCMAGCDRDEETVRDEPTVRHAERTAASAAARTVSEPAQAAETAEPILRSAARTCRALSVRGKVTAQGSGDPIRTGDALDEAPWLELAEDSTLVVKHARSARELTFKGPAEIQPCRDDAEHFLVKSGEIITTAGVGARPGAEVLIATPLGVVRYADARLTATVREDRFVVSVQQGTAWIEGRDPEPAPEEVLEGKSATRQGRPPDVKLVLERCEKAASETEARARAVLDRDAEQQTLGRRAAEHLRARQAARKACGIAAATLAGGSRGGKRQELMRRLEQADQRWREVPRGGGHP